MIIKADVKPGVSVRIDKVECRNLLPGGSVFGQRAIELNASGDLLGEKVVRLLLGEVLEILSLPKD
jgi:hypothetical protein